MSGLFRLSLLALALCAVAALADLGRFAKSPQPESGRSPIAARAPARESVASKLRRAISGLDTMTTAKGAYFWPGVGNSCGFPRR